MLDKELIDKVGCAELMIKKDIYELYDIMDFFNDIESVCDNIKKPEIIIPNDRNEYATGIFLGYEIIKKCLAPEYQIDSFFDKYKSLITGICNQLATSLNRYEELKKLKTQKITEKAFCISMLFKK